MPTRDIAPAPPDQPPRRPTPLVDRPPLPTVVLADAADPADLRARVRAGSLVRVRRGVYAPPPPDGPAWQRSRHLLLSRAAAAHAVRRAEHWFSHETAAVLWGCAVARMPEIPEVMGRVQPHVARGSDESVRRRWTSRTSAPGDVCTELDLPVSSLERTALDCASTLRVDSGLVVADSALRLGADPDRLARMLEAATGQRGVRRARQVLALADGRADSAGETLVRYALVTAGLPAPEPQVAIRTALGWRWVDLGWPEYRVAVEFDGRGKYGPDASSVVRSFTEERRRQEAIEDEGWRVLRFTWPDLARPDALAARVARVLRQKRTPR